MKKVLSLLALVAFVALAMFAPESPPSDTQQTAHVQTFEQPEIETTVGAINIAVVDTSPPAIVAPQARHVVLTANEKTEPDRRAYTNKRHRGNVATGYDYNTNRAAAHPPMKV